MRTCLAFFLAVLLSLNAAYAAVVGVCDALENTTSHAAHFGHHSHDHADDTDPVDPAHDGKLPAAADDHHAHVHPGFASMVPSAIGVAVQEGSSSVAVAPARPFASALQSRLDRPPRAVLA